tara:strand:+ start:20671 stop:21138 length:468 start_codon:yes stop_codon:yes gene_type:complete
MAYKQKNNPFTKSIKEMTDKEYDKYCDNLKGGPGSDPAEEAARAQGRKPGEMNASSSQNPNNRGKEGSSGMFYTSAAKKLDRSKAKRNDPDDGVVSASEASGGMFYSSAVKKAGLWDNIHKKRKRIASGSGEKMRKPGAPGAPSAKNLKDSQTKK